MVEVMLMQMVLLLILIVRHSGVHHACGGNHRNHGRKEHNVDKGNLDGPNYGLQINQNCI